jgi:hypothetical protein
MRVLLLPAPPHITAPADVLDIMSTYRQAGINQRAYADELL